MAQIAKGVTTTGAQESLRVDEEKPTHAVQVVFTGSITALVFDLEGSLDGVNFATLGSHTFSAGEITAKHALFHIVDKPVDYVRVNFTTVTGSGTISAFYE